MLSISNAVNEIVTRSPFLEEILGSGIANLSALARYIHPQVEEKVLKDVKNGAIIVALKRLAVKLNKKKVEIKTLKNLGDITVRSNLVEFTFANSESLIERQKKLLHEIGHRKEIFYSLSQGVVETTIIVSANVEREVDEIFGKEKLLSKFVDLFSITIKLPKEVVKMAGAYYSIFKLFALEGITIIEVISTYTELTLVLHNKDIERAFSILKSSFIG